MHDRENCAHGLAISLSLQRFDWESGRVCTSKRASEGKKGIIPSSLFPIPPPQPSLIPALTRAKRRNLAKANGNALRKRHREMHGATPPVVVVIVANEEALHRVLLEAQRFGIPKEKRFVPLKERERSREREGGVGNEEE